jgi:deazaflavin-dependent oxidoreductase (nitroreductase family)
MSSWNDTVIENFRAHHGVLGGHWEGKKVLLVHVIGRRTGKETVNPLVAAPEGDGWIVCGSAGGAPEDPVWVANLEAATGPVTIEDGDRVRPARVEVVRPGDVRWERLYGIWRTYWPDAADYETKTDRKFPVAIVTPQD